MNAKNFIKSVTYPLSLLRSPVWLFDVDSLQVVWANASALALCGTAEVAELQSRNMAFDLSCKVRERLKRSDVEPSSINDPMSELLTLFPDDQPITYECSISSMVTPTGERWLLVNGIRQVTRSSSEALYRNYALLHTSVFISVYDLDGQLKYSNPAACRMLGSDTGTLSERFHDQEEWRSIRSELFSSHEVRTDARVATSSGYAWHSLTLELCPDPVLAESTILVTELDVSTRHRAQEQVQQLAYHDALTGLPNRASWDKKLKAMCESERKPLSLLFMDLNGFKSVNDTYGHDVGDKLLIAVGMRISDCLDKDEFLARLGGDEFILLMNDEGIGGLAAHKARQILNSLATPIVIEGHELCAAPSIGISWCETNSADEIERTMQEADVAMYQAKRTGGGFVQYSTQMSKNRRSDRTTRRNSNRGRGPLGRRNDDFEWPVKSAAA